MGLGNNQIMECHMETLGTDAIQIAVFLSAVFDAIFQ